jgi:YVTN family beta-propeller protein
LQVGTSSTEGSRDRPGARAYVSNQDSGSVSVISTATNRITATIHDLCDPIGVAVSPGGTHIYVVNNMARGTVSVVTSD